MKNLLLFFMLLMINFVLKAQDFYKKDTTKVVANTFIIKLKDGTQLKGYVIEQNVNESKIQTQTMGIVTINTNQIVSMELANNNSLYGSIYFKNQFVNRMVYMPTGFAMEKGAIEYHNYMFYYNEVSAALGERVSIGAGVLPYFFFIGYLLKAKATIVASDNFNFSVTGNLFGVTTNIGSHTSGTAVLITPTISIGKKEKFFNISTVFAPQATSGGFLLSLGYMVKASPLLTVFTENIFPISSNGNVGDGGGALLSGGLRFDRARHAFDVNMLVYINNINSRAYYIPVPTVGYHLKINK